MHPWFKDKTEAQYLGRIEGLLCCCGPAAGLYLAVIYLLGGCEAKLGSTGGHVHEAWK